MRSLYTLSTRMFPFTRRCMGMSGGKTRFACIASGDMATSGSSLCTAMRCADVMKHWRAITGNRMEMVSMTEATSHHWVLVSPSFASLCARYGWSRGDLCLSILVAFPNSECPLWSQRCDLHKTCHLSLCELFSYSFFTICLSRNCAFACIAVDLALFPLPRMLTDWQCSGIMAFQLYWWLASNTTIRTRYHSNHLDVPLTV